MPLNPSKALRFDSWENLLQWLPHANESQLMTVFVWSGEHKAPGSEGPKLAQVRKEAFEHLVQRTSERMGRYLTQRFQCRDQDLVEDVIQQVLVKLFVRAEQFDPRRSFWGWLYRIAHNEYIDMLRRTRPGDIGMGQAGRVDEETEDWLDRQVTLAVTPGAAALETERRQLFEDAVASLPKLQQAVMRHKREGMTGKEIATRLGISQAYVSQLYHEAIEVLREALAP